MFFELHPPYCIMDPDGKMQKSTNLSYTPITEFVLVGFTGVSQVPELIGVTFIITFTLTLLGNVFVVLIIKHNESLHTPMYIIICNLALSDLMYSTVISPKVIQVYLTGSNTIRVPICLIQMYFLHFAGSVHSYMLLVMAIDRYVSICHPLRYPSLLSNTKAQLLCLGAWMLGAVSPLVHICAATLQPYCGPNKIPHLYCEYGIVISLSCNDVFFFFQLGSTIACLILICPFVLVVLSYLRITISVLKIDSSGRRMKAVYTCSTQLLVISIYFLPRLFVYIAFVSGMYMPGDVRVSLGLLYCLLPPLVNPMIYSFRLNEIRQIIAKALKIKKNIPVKIRMQK
ncbi:olfactory receptor 6N1-like [Erpetoichthys calabaricus]|uniref:olfactory receptor 6N1-like n=1 Tax=Erpetoichthys calabaricus TaxID=27687 RepID=UPI00223447BC|nr:olfactory receptor 6N1-like [Erpetoichthys calabaricus]